MRHGKPFLCSRNPDEELASLQAFTANLPYQYGSLQFYSAASGNLSVWYAVNENFDFKLVYNYRTCGVRVVAPASLVVRLALSATTVVPFTSLQVMAALVFHVHRSSACRLIRRLRDTSRPVEKNIQRKTQVTIYWFLSNSLELFRCLSRGERVDEDKYCLPLPLRMHFACAN